MSSPQIVFVNAKFVTSVIVFISKLVAGGHAANAGLEVGDLIVGMSGNFDSVEDMFGEGLDRV